MLTGTAITNVRTATSHDLDDQVSLAQYVAFVQSEQDRMRLRLSSAVRTLYNNTYSPASYVLAGAAVTLAKPSDFLAMVRMEKLFGSTYFPVWVADGLDTSGLRSGLEFREEGDNYIVEPADAAPGTYRLTYVDTGAVLCHTPKTVRLACAAALPAYTAAGAGIGATLTMNATGVVTIDGSAVALADRFFLPPELAAAADQAGIYKCTTAGAIGVAAIFTRATDCDEPKVGEMEVGMAVRPTAGTANVGKTYVLTTNVPIVIDTTELAFTEYASGAITDAIEVPVGLEDCLCERVAARVRKRCNEDPTAEENAAEALWREVIPILKKRYGAHAVGGLRRVRGDS